MSRVVFLVDGFNLYHSLVAVERDTQRRPAKWLDLKALCLSYVSVAGQRAGAYATLERIYYFSANPVHRSSAKQDRHRLYMRCLRETGISVKLAKFKRKEVWCPLCGRKFLRHEEKETDVAIAVRLFETCQCDEADTTIIVSGDTDLAPAVRTCQRLFPEKLIFFAFPYKRKNQALEDLAPESFNIKPKSILKHQFPDPLELKDGTRIHKPVDW